MTQLRGEQETGPGRAELSDVAGVFDSLFRLTFLWAARPVTRLYLERAAVGVEPTHHLVLRAIAGSGPLRLGQVAVRAGMTPSNASKVVAELVDGGLVSRRVPRDDRRVTLLELTEAGAYVVGRMEQVGAEMLGERLADFAPDEVAELRRLLAELADRVEAWTATLHRDPGNGQPADRPGDHGRGGPPGEPKEDS